MFVAIVTLPKGRLSAPCAGTVGYDLTSEPDGTYTLLVRATDAAGNLGGALKQVDAP